MSAPSSEHRETRATKRKLETEKKETLMALKSTGCQDENSQKRSANEPDKLKLSVTHDTNSPSVTTSSHKQPLVNTRSKLNRSSSHKSSNVKNTKCPKRSSLVKINKDCQSVSVANYYPCASGSLRSQKSLVQDAVDVQAVPGKVDTNLKEAIPSISTGSVSNGPESSTMLFNNKNSGSHLSKKSLDSLSSLGQNIKNKFKDDFQESATSLDSRKANASRHSPSDIVCTVSKTDSCDETQLPRLTRPKGRTTKTNVCDKTLPSRLNTQNTKTNTTVDKNTNTTSLKRGSSKHTNAKTKAIQPSAKVTLSVINGSDSSVPDKIEDEGIKTHIDSRVKLKSPTNESCNSSTISLLSSSVAISRADCSSSGLSYNEEVVQVKQLKRHLWQEQLANNKNVYHSFSNAALGKFSLQNKKAIVDTYITSRLFDLEVTGSHHPFCCRVTAIGWHPHVENLVCLASKHGDLSFSKVGKNSQLQDFKHFTGIGPGGCISAVKFHPLENEKFYTSALDGKVCLGNFEKDQTSASEILLNNNCDELFEQWYSALDVHQTQDMVVAGDTKGWAACVSRNGELIWKKRLHKMKISHLEFCSQDPHLLCSASLDRTVRMWDIRMVVDQKPLECLLHDKGLNSAYFSLTDGTRLLTTDQFDEIRVYRAPFWHLETCIKHPHRFFQHITPIKANWHPVSDNIICGRYPDEQKYSNLGSQKVIDVFDASTGKMSLELKDVQSKGIVSLNQFNRTGDKLLTAMGYNIHVWSHVQDDEEGMSHREKSSKGSAPEGAASRSQGKNPEVRPPRGSHQKQFFGVRVKKCQR